MDETRLDEAIDTLESELRFHRRAEEILAGALPGVVTRFLTPRPHVFSRDGWMEVRDTGQTTSDRLNVVSARVQFRGEPEPHYFIVLSTYKGVLGLIPNKIAFVVPEAEMNFSSARAWKKWVDELASRMAKSVRATHERWGAQSEWTHFAEDWPDPITDAEVARILSAQ